MPTDTRGLQVQSSNTLAACSLHKTSLTDHNGTIIKAQVWLPLLIPFLPAGWVRRLGGEGATRVHRDELSRNTDRYLFRRMGRDADSNWGMDPSERVS